MTKRQPKKTLPKFKNLQEEVLFWETHDSSEYIDWKKAKKVKFPHLKSSANNT